MIFSIATCSKSNLDDLINTCSSVVGIVTKLEQIEFEHILLLSDYSCQDIETVQSILSSYPQNISHNICHIEAIGISASFNLALEKAIGDYIIFLNAGDEFITDPICLNCIENQFLDNKFPPNQVYYFDIFTKGKSTSYLSSRRVSYPSHLNYFHFLKMGNPINHQATMYPRNIAQKYSYPNMAVGMDYQVNLSMILDGIEFVKLNGVLVKYDITGVSAKKPFIRLKQTFPFLLAKAWEYNLFLLVIASISILPLSIVRAIIQKLTYNLR